MTYEHDVKMSRSTKGTSMGKVGVNHMPIRQPPCVGEYMGRSCLTWEDT